MYQIHFHTSISIRYCFYVIHLLNVENVISGNECKYDTPNMYQIFVYQFQITTEVSNATKHGLEWNVLHMGLLPILCNLCYLSPQSFYVILQSSRNWENGQLIDLEPRGKTLKYQQHTHVKPISTQIRGLLERSHR